MDIVEGVWGYELPLGERDGVAVSVCTSNREQVELRQDVVTVALYLERDFEGLGCNQVERSRGAVALSHLVRMPHIECTDDNGLSLDRVSLPRDTTLLDLTMQPWGIEDHFLQKKFEIESSQSLVEQIKGYMLLQKHSENPFTLLCARAGIAWQESGYRNMVRTIGTACRAYAALYTAKTREEYREFQSASINEPPNWMC